MSKKTVFAGMLVLASILLAGAEDKAHTTFTGEIADSQCALNVHSLTRSHTEMYEEQKYGRHSDQLHQLLHQVSGR